MNSALKVALLLMTAVAVSCAAMAVVTAPSGSRDRIGIRGLVRQKALAKGGTWAAVEPLVRWLGMRFRGVLTTQLRVRLDRQVVMAGTYLGLFAEELVALSVLGAASGLACGLVADALVGLGPSLLLGTCGFGAMAPFLDVSSVASDRAKAIGRRLPSAIDLLALSMSAGLDFPTAVRLVVDKSGTPNDPLIAELTILLQSLQLGRTRRQALEELAERAPVRAVSEFVSAVVQAELRGNPLADVLRIQAEVSRQRRTELAEEAAAKAGVRMILPVVFVFVAIMILIAGPIMLELSQSGL
jgi:tight adherence protein C